MLCKCPGERTHSSRGRFKEKEEGPGVGGGKRGRAQGFISFFNCTLRQAVGPRAARRAGWGTGSPRPAEPGRAIVRGGGNSQGIDLNFSPGTHEALTEAFCTAPEGREPTQIGERGIAGAFPRLVPRDIII